MSYKIKIQLVQEDKKHPTAAALLDTLVKSLSKNEFNIQTTVSSDVVNTKTPYDSGFYHSLKKALPDGSDIRFGEVSYEPGLGGSYGVGYTIYLPEDIAPAIYIDPYYDDSPSANINTEAFIQATLQEDEEMQAAFDAFQEDSENRWETEDIEDFIESIGWHSVGGDNSYNEETDLDSCIDYTIATKEKGADHIYSDHVVIFLRVHRGGDVRCNYSSVKVFRYADSGNESAFYSRSIGWSLYDAKDKDGNELGREETQAIDEHWQEGYSHNPTYQLQEDIKTAKLSACGSYYDITLKDGTTGKVRPVNYNIG